MSQAGGEVTEPVVAVGENTQPIAQDHNTPNQAHAQMATNAGTAIYFRICSKNYFVCFTLYMTQLSVLTIPPNFP